MNGSVPGLGVAIHTLQAVTPTRTPPPDGLGAGLAAGLLLLVIYLVVVLVVVLGGSIVVVLAVRRGHLFGVELGPWQHRLFVASGVSLLLGLVATVLVTAVGALLLGVGVLTLLVAVGWVVAEAVRGRFDG